MRDPQLDMILRLLDPAPTASGFPVEATYERQLKSFYHHYILVLDTMPAVIYVKTGDGRYIFCNKAWSSFTGLDRDSVVGKTVFDVYPRDFAAALDAGDKRIIADKAPTTFDDTFPFTHGDSKILRSIKAPVYDESGELRLIVGMAHDITEQKRAEEALAKSRTELTTTRENLMRTIRELSTPVLPIHDGVLVVPLVGHLDSQRSAQFTDTLLLAIQQHRAETVIIDITGVDLVDTAVANHLLQAMRAAALLGTECVLVGIAPQIARTLVQIGVDFGALTTRRDLQAGIAYALAKRPYADAEA